MLVAVVVDEIQVIFSDSKPSKNNRVLNHLSSSEGLGDVHIRLYIRKPKYLTDHRICKASKGGGL